MEKALWIVGAVGTAFLLFISGTGLYCKSALPPITKEQGIVTRKVFTPSHNFAFRAVRGRTPDTYEVCAISRNFKGCTSVEAQFYNSLSKGEVVQISGVRNWVCREFWPETCLISVSK